MKNARFEVTIAPGVTIEVTGTARGYQLAPGVVLRIDPQKLEVGGDAILRAEELQIRSRKSR